MMLVDLVTKELTNEELKAAFKEIEEWMDTGILNQNGSFKAIHNKIETGIGMPQSIQATERVILFEIAKRFSNEI